MSLIVDTPPAAEPLTSADAALRQHLHLEDDEAEQDTVLDSYCAAARQHVEDFTRRRLITQTLVLRRDGFPGYGAISLQTAPVQSVNAVRYLDGAGDWQALDSALYRTITSSCPNEVAAVYGSVWPVPRPDRDSVEIEFTVGYGTTVAAVPPGLVQAMRLLAAHMFLHREAVVMMTPSTLPMGVRMMLDPYRIWL